MNTTDPAILVELRAIRAILEARQTQTPRREMMKAPEAAKALGIGYIRLRKLIENGDIPARCINPDRAKKQYIINISEAVEALRGK